MPHYAPYAATIADGLARPVCAHLCDDGSQAALAADARDALRHYYILIDDDAMVCGYRILADEWYDAADNEQSPDEFAARLFDLSEGGT